MRACELWLFLSLLVELRDDEVPKTDKPNAVSLDEVMPDLRDLDEVVFEAFGLTEDERLSIYRAVVELVKTRLVKAKSV